MIDSDSYSVIKWKTIRLFNKIVFRGVVRVIVLLCVLIVKITYDSIYFSWAQGNSDMVIALAGNKADLLDAKVVETEASTFVLLLRCSCICM